jgi:hypothetical protein
LDGDPARLVLLGAGQAQAQHPVLELGLDAVRVDAVGQLQRAAEAAAAAFAAVVGLLLLRGGTADAAEGERVPVRLDLEILLRWGAW